MSRLAAVRITIIVAFAAVFALLGIAIIEVFADASAGSPKAAIALDVTNVPVIVWHEMNNGCKPQDATCAAPDPETVSSRQFGDELNWLHQQGYHTVTISQYIAWTEDEQAPLPSKPVLLIADNGIGNFLLGAQPYLARYGDHMTAAIVTGFADGAAGKCPHPGAQPGCGVDNRGWDLTWPQLKQLGPEYDFILEAGASGHFVQAHNTHYYTTRLPGESDSSYAHRVTSEQSQGWQELVAELGSRVDTHAWVVPYSDLGYPRGDLPSSTPQSYNGPNGWLVSYAGAKYQAVFVEDAERNGIQHERFRLDVNGVDTLSYFATTLQSDARSGDFARGSAPVPAPVAPARADSIPGLMVIQTVLIALTILAICIVLAQLARPRKVTIRRWLALLGRAPRGGTTTSFTAVSPPSPSSGLIRQRPAVPAAHHPNAGRQFARSGDPR